MPLRVAINAQLPLWSTGGGSTVLLGMIRALGQLDDGDEEYTIIGTEQNRTILSQFIGANQRIVTKSREQLIYERIHAARRRFGRLIAPRRWYEVPVSENKFYERLQCDVIHFAYPYYVFCGIPALFQIYDLQHRHFPQYFDLEDLKGREGIYYGGCHYAQKIIVGSAWTKRDLEVTYGIHPDKMHVIMNGPPTEAYAEPTSAEKLQERYGIQTPFMLYPASTHPHKNHLRLLEAFNQLRDDIPTHLVCTGPQNSFFSTIKQSVADLNLESRVSFLGIVPPEDLRGLYQSAQFVIFPSHFEGVGYPPLEAFYENVAVASSNATSLPEIVGESGLLFDPYSIEAIQNAIYRMATDDVLRADLKSKGNARLSQFDWRTSAKMYRALYRQLAHKSLTEEDRQLLGELS